jgi:hypothetical protein
VSGGCFQAVSGRNSGTSLASKGIRGVSRAFRITTCFTELHRLTVQEGQIPTWRVFQEKAQIGSEVLLRRRFRGARGLRRAYRAWLETNEPGSPILNLLNARLPTGLVVRTASSFMSDRTVSAENPSPLLGPIIHFRGLEHAPTNEQGVVYIFGVVSYELGFIVESLQPFFPDCHAKRRTDNGCWRRVRIEFEFRSKLFYRHGHPPEAVDLIVCWQHDWPDCPVEVLELKTAIASLMQKQG